MEVYQGPLSLSLSNELDDSLDVISDCVTFIIVINLNVFVAKEKIVVDSVLVGTDGSDYVHVF